MSRMRGKNIKPDALNKRTDRMSLGIAATILALRCLIGLTIIVLFAVTIVGQFGPFSYDDWRRYCVGIILLFFCLQALKFLLALRGQFRSSRSPWAKLGIIIRAVPAALRDSQRKIEALPKAKLRVIVFLVCFLAFSIVRGHLITIRDSGLDMGRYLSGDEPAYLLIAHSLVADADVNLANNREAQHGWHFGAPHHDGHCGRDEPGRAYSKHGAGLALLIAPFYAIGLFLGGPPRLWALLFLNILVALFATVLLSILLNVFASKRLAFGVSLIVSLSSPIVYYSNHLYPEPVVALIGVLLIKTVYFPPARRWIGDVATGIMLGFLPWLHTKNILLVLLFIMLVAIERRSFRSYLLVGLPVLASAALLMAHLYYCFESVLPSAPYLYGPRKMGTPIGNIPRISALKSAAPGLLFDRDYGLLMWSPMYAFALPGLFFLHRRAPRILRASLNVSLATFLVHAVAPGWHGGWAPPVRFLVPIAGPVGIALAAFLDSRPRKLILALFLAAVLVSLAGGYREGTKHLFLRRSRVHYLAFRAPRAYHWMPVFIPADAATARSYIIALVFAALCVILTLVALRTAKRRFEIKTSSLARPEPEPDRQRYSTR